MYFADYRANGRTAMTTQAGRDAFKIHANSQVFSSVIHKFRHRDSQGHQWNIPWQDCLTKQKQEKSDCTLDY